MRCGLTATKRRTTLLGIDEAGFATRRDAAKGDRPRLLQRGVGAHMCGRCCDDTCCGAGRRRRHVRNASRPAVGVTGADRRRRRGGAELVAVALSHVRAVRRQLLSVVRSEHRRRQIPPHGRPLPVSGSSSSVTTLRVKYIVQ